MLGIQSLGEGFDRDEVGTESTVQMRVERTEWSGTHPAVTTDANASELGNLDATMKEVQSESLDKHMQTTTSRWRVRPEQPARR